MKQDECRNENKKTKETVLKDSGLPASSEQGP